MRIWIFVLMSCAAATAAPRAAAEVLAVDAGGFELRQVVESRLAPADAFRRFAVLADWWSDAHTYSGQARNLSLDLRPGGCWCEQLAGQGGVEHMRVVYVDPGRAVRFSGGLGPLQELGVAGVMTVSFKAIDGGTRVTMVYRVGGRRTGGFADLAPLVDQVLATQFARFAALA